MATPDDAAPRGQWWTRFEDPDLNDLETQVSTANQSLRAALARLDEARAETRIARASYFPTLDASATATRQRISKNIPSFHARHLGHR